MSRTLEANTHEQQRPSAPDTDELLGAPGWGRRTWLRASLASLSLAALPRWVVADTDPLPSWNDGVTKRTVIDFVSAVTQKGSPHFVDPAARVATFDNDGTLWCEQPTVEGVYTAERVKALMAKHPELRKQEPYASLLAAGGGDPLAQLESEKLLRVLADTHTGMTEDEFAHDVRRFFASAKHPRFRVPYTQVAYLPQIELLQYLRANGFSTWICSGGEISFMRVLAEQSYGIPPERVIGTYFMDRAEERDGQLILRRVNKLVSFNDKDAKPVNIQHQIGRRPILAVGNERSGGDISMLRYAQNGPGPALSLLVDHDDPEREYSYEERDGASLGAARRYGFTVISIKRDWRRVFDFES